MKMKLGAYEEAKKFIGKKGAMLQAEMPISKPLIELFLASVENANPCYWDEEYAKERFGDFIAPHAMLMSLIMKSPWIPDAYKKPDPEGISLMDVPLPGDTVINVTTETEFFKPIKVGDKISFQDELEAISEEKMTRLGTGNWITSASKFYNQNGELVAINRNILFRYKAGSPTK